MYPPICGQKWCPLQFGLVWMGPTPPGKCLFWFTGSHFSTKQPLQGCFSDLLVPKKRHKTHLKEPKTDSFCSLHPRRLTWNLRIHLWKGKILFQRFIFRFYVNLPRCKKASSFIGGFFRCNDVAGCQELIFQSNPTLEPVVKWWGSSRATWLVCLYHFFWGWNSQQIVW